MVIPLMIKNSINSIVFNDGYLYLLKLTDNGEIDYTSKQLYYFGIRTITQKRIDEAAQIQAQYDLCVHIPLKQGMQINKNDVVIVRGTYYRIEQIQEIYTTSPQIAVLTLSRWEMDFDNLDIGGD